MPQELADTNPSRELRRYQVTIEHVDRTFPLSVNRYVMGACRRRHLHKHPEYEIVYIQSDSGVFLYESTELRFGPGDVILNTANRYHHPIFDSASNQGLLVIYFDPTLLTCVPREWGAALAALQSLDSWHLRNRPEVGQLVAEALRHFQSQRLHWQILCQGALLHLLSIFAREIVIGCGAAAPYRDDRLWAALDYIERNLCSDLSADQIYAAAGMSRSSFCRRFKRCFGTSAQDYIQRKRIARAKELLSATALAVAQIGYACGFSSLTVFNRTFKEWVGATPSNYRRRGATSPFVER